MKRFGQPSSNRKLFLLALDATPLTFLQDNISVLPNIGALLRSGRTVKTGSPANLLSACPWQTFASGLMPGEQGHYFPLQWDASTMKFIPIKEKSLLFKPFWDDLAHGGVETIVFDAMAVPLNDGAPGLQVINWNTQCNFAASSNRADVLKSIQRNFGKKPIGDEIRVKKSRRALAAVRDQLIQSTRKKTDAILWVMRAFDWQCFITAYFEGHRAGHNLWPIWEDFASDPPEEAMLDVYREIDDQIGRLLNALDLSNTGIILFSMHGMTAGYAQDHFLPEIMERINRLYLSKLGHQVAPRRPGLARVLRQTVPASVQLQIRELVGQTVQDWLVDREWRGGHDWKTTPAFPVPGGGDVGFIRLNVQGRERQGFLAAEEEASSGYLEFLCRQLKALRIKETNEPLVDEIALARDAFSGPLSHLLPDVLATWHPDCPATEIWSEDLETIKATLKTGRGGGHTGDSFALLAGAISDGLPPLAHIRDYKQFLKGFFAQA